MVNTTDGDGGSNCSMQNEFIRRHHWHDVRENPCTSSLVKNIKAPVPMSSQTGHNSVIAGGLQETLASSPQNTSLARFAVEEYNKRENKTLEFGRVVKAVHQLVAGMSYRLTLEAIDAGKTKIYEARIWERSWLNLKELTAFNHIGNAPTSPPLTHLGVPEEGTRGDSLT